VNSIFSPQVSLVLFYYIKKNRNIRNIKYNIRYINISYPLPNFISIPTQQYSKKNKQTQVNLSKREKLFILKNLLKIV